MHSLYSFQKHFNDMKHINFSIERRTVYNTVHVLRVKYICHKPVTWVSVWEYMSPAGVLWRSKVKKLTLEERVYWRGWCCLVFVVWAVILMDGTLESIAAPLERRFTGAPYGTPITTRPPKLAPFSPFSHWTIKQKFLSCTIFLQSPWEALGSDASLIEILSRYANYMVNDTSSLLQLNSLNTCHRSHNLHKYGDNGETLWGKCSVFQLL